MKKFYKALAILLAAVLLVGGTFAATVAWMTAKAEPKKNVFTVGDIAISLEEETGVDGDGATVTDHPDGAEYIGVMPGDKLIKKATVTNEGDVPAYVAVTVTVNNADQLNYAIDEVYEKEPYNYDAEQIQAIYDLVFEGWGLRYNKVDGAGNALGMRLTNKLSTNEILLHVDSVKVTDLDNDYYFYAYNNWLQTEAEKENTAYGRFPAADGFYPVGNATLGLPAMEDYELRYTYFLHLDPGEAFTPFDGLNAPEFFNNDQMKLFDGLEIDIEAAAIQADNFETAQEAFEALYAVTTPEIPQVSVNNQAELEAAIAEGKTTICLNPGQYDLKGIQKNGLTLVGVGDVEVANTTDFASNGKLGAIWKAVNLKNVTLTNNVYTMAEGSKATFTDVTFAMGVRRAYGSGAVYTGCAFGTNTDGYAFHYETETSDTGIIELTDCEFQGGKVHLGGARTYVFTGCKFAPGTDFQIWSDIILDGCTVDGVEVTAENLNTLFPNLNAARVTIK